MLATNILNALHYSIGLVIKNEISTIMVINIAHILTARTYHTTQNCDIECGVGFVDDNSISVTYTDEGTDKLISDHYQSLMEQINKRVTELKSSHFKDYTGLSSLQNTSKHLFSHLKYNEDFLSNVCHALSETSKSLNMLNAAIIEKLEAENLQSWLDRPIASQGLIYSPF